MKLRDRAKQLKTDIPALYLSLKNSETPFSVKILAGITIAYALSPIDLIPDFIPVLGYLDDLILLPLLITLTVRLIPHDIFEESRKEAQGMDRSVLAPKWYYAIPAVLIWVIVMWMLMRAMIF